MRVTLALLLVLAGCANSRRQTANAALAKVAGHPMTVSVDAGTQITDADVTRLTEELAFAINDSRCTGGWECALLVQADIYGLASALRDVHFVSASEGSPPVFDRATGTYTVTHGPGQERSLGSYYIRDVVKQSLNPGMPETKADPKTYARYVVGVIENHPPCRIRALVPVYDRLSGASLVAARLQLVQPYAFDDACPDELEMLEQWYALHEDALTDGERRGVQRNIESAQAR